MEHKFKNEIIDWRNGGKYEACFSGLSGRIDWCPLNKIGAFEVADEVRKVDEYMHLKEAYLQGKTIQRLIDGKWKDIKSTPAWSYPVKEYRIKPKTKKMVQWLFNDGENYFSPNIFYDHGFTPQEIYCKPIKPLQHTEIEVDIE